MGEAKRPLAGIRVIDFGQYIAGPAVAMILADQGADVIRVEAPGGPVWDSPANAILNRMADVAASLQAMRGRREASSLVDRAIEIAAQVDGGGELSVPVARARNTLGGRLIELDRLDEAEYQLLSSYSVLRHVRGDRCPWTREVLVHLIKLYEAVGRPDQAQVYSARLRSR